MDSGCTFHITPDREVLFDFKALKGGKALMANNSDSEVKRGKIKILTVEGTIVIVTDVKYMPEARRNLISYGMLDISGCKYEGEIELSPFSRRERQFILGNTLMVYTT